MKRERSDARTDVPVVFKSSGLWDENADAPRSSASINFEQYLASALHAKLKVRHCLDGESCRRVSLDRERSVRRNQRWTRRSKARDLEESSDSGRPATGRNSSKESSTVELPGLSQFGRD